ncbi:MAG TPA: ribosome biogenesis factor YjgA [Gammaproteobacteria bacterium]|nr:ribosome biogenesis factor YjgA [Gammaproteobacteria bacterium]
MNKKHDPDDDFDADDDLEDTGDDSEENLYAGPSKSQRKRDADALQKLGEELITLKNSDLAQFDLPDNLLNAIQAARSISSHGGLKRQRQYIGKIMRSIDAAAVASKLDELRHKHELNSSHFKKLEHWRDRILAEGNKAIDDLLTEYPQADRQMLRQLQRNSQKELDAGKPPAAARQLFKYLRQLAEQN